jgi:hypothetical protein
MRSARRADFRLQSRRRNACAVVELQASPAGADGTDPGCGVGAMDRSPLTGVPAMSVAPDPYAYPSAFAVDRRIVVDLP